MTDVPIRKGEACRLKLGSLGGKLQAASSDHESIGTDQKSPMGCVLRLRYLPGSHAPESEVQV